MCVATECSSAQRPLCSMGCACPLNQIPSSVSSAVNAGLTLQGMGPLEASSTPAQIRLEDQRPPVNFFISPLAPFQRWSYADLYTEHRAQAVRVSQMRDMSSTQATHLRGIASPRRPLKGLNVR